MQKAKFYKIIDQGKLLVQCFLCHQKCCIKEGGRGLCQVRENSNGTLYSLNYGRLISENIDPIEKKPVFHMLPGSLSYSISTVGCNFRCLHCQNWQISQYPRLYRGDIPGTQRTPQEVVAAALRYNCQSISYTYVEPTIFYEFAFDTAKLAHKAGLKNVFVSNGYTGTEAARELIPYLDANNIDLKAFTDKFYREICGARLTPVLDNIRLMKEAKVWLEVTTLVIPGWNDSEDELRDIAAFIKGVSPEIPWHVTRFFPTYKMTDRPPTPLSTLRRAREIGFETGLHHVFVGNIPGISGENTFCAGCGKIVIERTAFQIKANHLDNGICQTCQTLLAGIF